MSEGGNQLYDFREGYSGLQDSLLHMLRAPGGSGDASALQQTALDGYSGLSDQIGGSSNPVEELYSSSLPHQDPPGRGGSSSYYHHQGCQQYCLDPPAFPLFLASNPHEPPPPTDRTSSPAPTVLYDPPWAAQMGLFNQSPAAAGNSLQWLPNEWGGGFDAGGSICDGEDAEGWMRQSAAGTMLGFGLQRREREGRGSNNTERQRRGKMSEKFGVLRSLIPNPGGKHDKASILTEATDYISELLRTIGDLRALVEAKQRRTDKSRRSSAASDEAGIESSSSQHDPAGRPCSAVQPRCSWLQRSYKDTSVDVRIVEDDVTIKLVRRTSADCLLLVSRALHELRLELLHLAAANVGDSLVLIINSKIEEEGSSLSASVIAKKIVEALEGTVLCSF